MKKLSNIVGGLKCCTFMYKKALTVNKVMYQVKNKLKMNKVENS